MPTAPVHWLPCQARHPRTFSCLCGARLLCREDGQKVMVTSITFFTSLDAVHGFPGDGDELAVVEEPAGQPLDRWDERVSHHELVAALQ